MKKKDIKKTEPKTELKLTLQDRINYLKIALGICQVIANDETCELVLEMNDLIIEKKGQTDMISINKLEHQVRSKYRPKEKKK